MNDFVFDLTDATMELLAIKATVATTLKWKSFSPMLPVPASVFANIAGLLQALPAAPPVLVSAGVNQGSQVLSPRLVVI